MFDLRRTGFLLGACLLIRVVGCGSSVDIPDLVEVSGIVTLDGQPLPGATVYFIPKLQFAPAAGTDQPRLIEESAGLTDEQGHFRLRGIHKESGWGAMVGDHRVLIRKRVMKDGSAVPTGDVDLAILETSMKELLPAIYSDEQQTTLSAQVPTEGLVLNFDLQSKGK